MTKEAQKVEPINGELVPGTAIAVRPPTPMSLMQMGMERGASVETMTQLFALHREVMADEARRAFDAAFAAFKAKAPKLTKTKTVSFNTTVYKFAPLDEIAETVGPLLAENGLSYSWKQECTKEGITVTCVLSHVQGHSRENTLGPIGPDTSGSKNAIQAMGSAVTYLRRYTLKGVLGMADGDEDTDGMTMGNASELLDNIKYSADLGQLESSYKEAIKEGVKMKDPKALKVFFEARERREKELRAA